MASEPSPINTSSKSGAPVEARDEAFEAAVATVGVVSDGELETDDAGIGVPVDEDDAGVPAAEVGVTVDAAVVGCGHEASALSLSVPWMPQMVTGAVAPVPGLPAVPIGVKVEPAPSHVPLEFPSRAAVMAQSVTGAETGAAPVVVVPTCEGSHESLAVPSTATTMLHAFTGTTASAGALWLASLVGRSLARGNPASGMHIPLAAPSTSTIAPQAVTGTKTLAACPCWVTGSDRCGQLDELSPSISAVTSQTATGTSASTAPVWVLEPLVPVVSQSLDVFAARPTLTEQMLTGAFAFTAPSCDVDAEDWPPASPSAMAASFRRPMALSVP